ncbi:glucose-6-phosphate/phosphate translocator [Gracilaria domingensis]|nr:glucose-6-phosphate/phosphate translocator [Gracilaria domingensis]
MTTPPSSSSRRCCIKSISTATQAVAAAGLPGRHHHHVTDFRLNLVGTLYAVAGVIVTSFLSRLVGHAPAMRSTQARWARCRRQLQRQRSTPSGDVATVRCHKVMSIHVRSPWLLGLCVNVSIFLGDRPVQCGVVQHLGALQDGGCAVVGLHFLWKTAQFQVVFRHCAHADRRVLVHQPQAGEGAT